MRCIQARVEDHVVVGSGVPGSGRSMTRSGWLGPRTFRRLYGFSVFS